MKNVLLIIACLLLTSCAQVRQPIIVTAFPVGGPIGATDNVIVKASGK